MSMNYLYLGRSLFGLQYIYVDICLDSGYVADSLFFRHKVPVKYGSEMSREGQKFRLIFCRIRRKHRTEFEKALGEISNKMSLLGHNDYDAFCETLMEYLNRSGKPDLYGMPI